MRQLLVATQNQGKLRELRALLAGRPIRLLSLADIGHVPEVEETGTTFLDNAILKAVDYSRHTDALTLADDSGLEVDALGGEPGVLSARYGGPGLDDEGRNRLVLEKLEKVPPEKRGARFVCVLALAQSGEPIETFRGAVEGRIAPAPRGPGGFGYDPIFFYPPKACTFGELLPAEKDVVSHRGAALREFLRYADSAL
jgi:XTP/dITP diphosphohydrolase